MIIKDHIGDWAICIADWVGMKKGARIGRRYQRGNPGQFSASVTFLRESIKCHGLTVDLGLQTHLNSAFSFNDLQVYPKTAQIKLDSTETEPFHKVALAYTLSTLCLLVQPRPESIPETPPRTGNGRRVRINFIFKTLFLSNFSTTFRSCHPICTTRITR